MRHVVSSYLYTHISYLLGFNTDDEILFDTKYYFYTQRYDIRIQVLTRVIEGISKKMFKLGKLKYFNKKNDMSTIILQQILSDKLLLLG